MGGLGSFIRGGGAVGALLGSGGGGDNRPRFDGGPPVPEFAMRKTQEFNPNNPTVQIGGPGGPQDLSHKFATQRAQVQGTGSANLAGNVEAIQRRFSAMGAGGSGAQIAAEQQAREANQGQTNQALEGVNTQETGALANRELQQANMEFQNRVQNFDQASKMHSLDLAERQQKIGAVTDRYNQRLSEFQAQPPPQGIISNLLGGIL